MRENEYVKPECVRWLRNAWELGMPAYFSRAPPPPPPPPPFNGSGYRAGGALARAYKLDQDQAALNRLEQASEPWTFFVLLGVWCGLERGDTIDSESLSKGSIPESHCSQQLLNTPCYHMDGANASRFIVSVCMRLCVGASIAMPSYGHYLS